jgi:hypothetical protein
MSTEHNVNRVQSNFNIEAEKAKLDNEAPTMDQLPVYDVLTGETKSPVVEPEDKLLEQDPEAFKKAWTEMNVSSVRIDEILDSPIIQEQLAQQGLQPNEEVLAQFRQLVGGDDLKVFRAQVIRALKHLGVDTKKFFGE